MTHHVINFSGGKDSTALVLLASEMAQKHGFDPKIVFADTGHEHPLTYEYIEAVQRHTGLSIRRVKADFSADIERKRAFIAERWGVDGLPQERIDRALSMLHPTGIPFLDLCIWKGRFPSTRARFCSEELKHRPIYEQVALPLMRSGRVLSWQGVRADESPERAKLPRLERGDGRLWHYRPILHWNVQDVFAMHRKHGLQPNPLYRLGMGRVGCMPCIHARKTEMAEIAKRFPTELERVAAWEAIVSAASKRGWSTFFSYDKTPGPHQSDHSLPMPRIKDVANWARTSRGGRQLDLLTALPPTTCTSLYGLCE